MRTKYPSETAEYSRARYRREKDQAIAVYGSRCVSCGSTDRLEFDHVNNDGAAHRREVATREWLRRVGNSGVPDPEWAVQLLCLPCHDYKACDVAELERRIDACNVTLAGLTHVLNARKAAARVRA